MHNKWARNVEKHIQTDNPKYFDVVYLIQLFSYFALRPLKTPPTLLIL